MARLGTSSALGNMCSIHSMTQTSHTSLFRSSLSPQHGLSGLQSSPGSSQRRHASFIRRPKRPYTFTQLVTLSDGSTYLHRTSSPAPIHRSTKDQRNSPLWNPSSARLRTVEADAAGRLRAFRARFGRGWDALEGSTDEVRQEAEGEETDGVKVLRGEGEEGTTARQTEVQGQEAEESLLDLIAGFQRDESVEQGMRSKKKIVHTPGAGKKKK